MQALLRDMPAAISPPKTPAAVAPTVVAYRVDEMHDLEKTFPAPQQDSTGEISESFQKLQKMVLLIMGDKDERIRQIEAQNVFLRNRLNEYADANKTTQNEIADLGGAISDLTHLVSLTGFELPTLTKASETKGGVGKRIQDRVQRGLPRAVLGRVPHAGPATASSKVP